MYCIRPLSPHPVECQLSARPFSLQFSVHITLNNFWFVKKKKKPKNLTDCRTGSPRIHHPPFPEALVASFSAASLCANVATVFWGLILDCLWTITQGLRLYYFKNETFCIRKNWNYCVNPIRSMHTYEKRKRGWKVESRTLTENF